MSQQGDAFVQRVLKADPAPTTFRDVVQYFRQRGGSGRGAARLAGVDERSFRRWAGGTRPRPGTVQKLMETYRTLRSAPSRMGDAGVMIPVVSRERRRHDRERDVSGVQLQLSPGTLAAAHQVWIKTGDGDAAARRFVQGIGEPWYKANLGRAFSPPTSAASSGSSGSSARGGGDEDDDDSGPADEEEYVGDEVDFELTDDYAMSIG